MRIRISRLGFALLLGSAAYSVTGAQVARPNRDVLGRPGRGQLGDSAPPAEQQALVRRLRQAFGGVVRRQLNLNDENWQKFERVDRQFQRQRNQLQRGERQTRFALKAAMEDTAGVDQNKIAQYLTELTQAQRRRADLIEAEQKELATFLTPLQRAKLQALREQLNRRVAQMQQQGAPGRRGPPPR